MWVNQIISLPRCYIHLIAVDLTVSILKQLLILFSLTLQLSKLVSVSKCVSALAFYAILMWANKIICLLRCSTHVIVLVVLILV